MPGNLDKILVQKACFTNRTLHKFSKVHLFLYSEIQNSECLWSHSLMSNQVYEYWKQKNFVSLSALCGTGGISHSQGEKRKGKEEKEKKKERKHHAFFYAFRSELSLPLNLGCVSCPPEITHATRLFSYRSS